MAAWQLTQRGCEVVVLEARDRVGGRVWSQELIPGDRRTVIERGAEFVLDGYDVLREVLAEFRLELAGTAMTRGRVSHTRPTRSPRSGATLTSWPPRPAVSISPASTPPVTGPARWKVPCGPGSAWPARCSPAGPLPADASSG